MDNWLEFATLCRKEKKYNLCKNVLKRLGSRVVETLDRNEGSSQSSGSRPVSTRKGVGNFLGTVGLNSSMHSGVVSGGTAGGPMNTATTTGPGGVYSTNNSTFSTSAPSNLTVPYIFNPSNSNRNSVRTTINNNNNYQQNKQFSSSNQVLFASCKYLWDIGFKQEALHELSNFIENMDANIRLTFIKESNASSSFINNNNSNNIDREKEKDMLRNRKDSNLMPASFGMISTSLLEDVENGRISNVNLAALGFNTSRSSTKSSSVSNLMSSNQSTSTNAGTSAATANNTLNNSKHMNLQENIHTQIYDSFPIDEKAFRVQCLLKRAEWLREVGDVPFSDVLRTVQEARELAPDQYSVWHEWAVANYNQLQIVDKIDRNSNNNATTGAVTAISHGTSLFPNTSRDNRERGHSMSSISGVVDPKDILTGFHHLNITQSSPSRSRNASPRKSSLAASTATKLHLSQSHSNDIKVAPFPPPPPPLMGKKDSTTTAIDNKDSPSTSGSVSGSATPILQSSPRSNTSLIKDMNTLKKLKISETYSKPSTVHGMTLANLVSVDQGQGKDAESEAMKYATEAIKGFVKSIIYGTGQPVANLLQDTLRLLTLWFSYGSKDSIYILLKTELDRISPQYWLRVIPQLIARMHVKSVKISELLRKLLIRLADSHPQALVCPISVALNTTYSQQKKMAQDVLKELRRNKGNIVANSYYINI